MKCTHDPGTATPGSAVLGARLLGGALTGAHWTSDHLITKQQLPGSYETSFSQCLGLLIIILEQLDLLQIRVDPYLAHALQIEGKLPEGLKGTLLRNGPGLFEVGGRKVPQVRAVWQ